MAKTTISRANHYSPECVPGRYMARYGKYPGYGHIPYSFAVQFFQYQVTGSKIN